MSIWLAKSYENSCEQQKTTKHNINVIVVEFVAASVRWRWAAVPLVGLNFQTQKLTHTHTQYSTNKPTNNYLTIKQCN